VLDSYLILERHSLLPYKNKLHIYLAEVEK